MPPEAQLFKNAHETGHPIRVIVPHDCALFPFALPGTCAYAFLGFFHIVEFQVCVYQNNLACEPYSSSKWPHQPIFSLAGNRSSMVSLSMTLQWGPGGDPVGDPPLPWWCHWWCYPTFEIFSQARISSVKLLQRIPSLINPADADASDEELGDRKMPPPAWHCGWCGRVNVITLLRFRWSWECSTCLVGPPFHYPPSWNF